MGIIYANSGTGAGRSYEFRVSKPHDRTLTVNFILFLDYFFVSIGGSMLILGVWLIDGY